MKKLSLLLVTIFFLTNTSNAQSKCKEIPGEYIVKYKSASVRGLNRKAVEDKKIKLRSQLNVNKVADYSSVSPNIEFVKTKNTKSKLSQDQLVPELSDQIEYIQPNCLYKYSDFSVSGKLRDPAKGAGAFPRSIVVPAGDARAINIIRPDKSLDSIDLTHIEKRSDDTTAEFEFEPQFIQIWDSADNLDALNDIFAVGEIKMTEHDGKVYYFRAYTSLKNRGNGTYEYRGDYNLFDEVTGTNKDLATADINNDLIPDFAVAVDKIIGGSVDLLISDEDDPFTEINLTFSSNARFVQLEDINADGNIDVVAYVQDTSSDFDGIEYYLRRDDSSFAPRRSIPQAAFLGEQGFKIKDVNKDGKPDFILFDSNEFSVIYNLGNEQFSQPYTYEYWRLFSDQDFFLHGRFMEVADINNDTYPDIVFTTGVSSTSNNVKDSGVFVFYNQNGQFSYTYQGQEYLEFDSFAIGVEDDSDRLSVSDVDGDKRLDVIVSRQSFDVVKVFLNKASNNPDNIVSFTEDKTYDILTEKGPYNSLAYDPFAINGAFVELTGNGKKYTVVTNEHGEFIFPAVPPGNYNATAWFPGYSFPTITNLDINVNSNINNLFHFAKRSPFVPPASPSTPPLNVTNDYGFNHLWGIHNYGQLGGKADVDTDANEAWSITRGEGVVVGVIDSGLDVFHPDIKDNLYINSGDVPNNGIDDDNNGYIDDTYGYNGSTNRGLPVDDVFHGTHVAGTIASTGNNHDGVVGVSPGAKILALKAGEDGGVSVAAILRSADYAIKAKQRGANLRVINASYGFDEECRPVDIDYVGALNRNDILLVVAAGNDKFDNDKIPSTPANCNFPNVISVAAVDRQGNLAEFSNFGLTQVDVAAPGVEILSLKPEAGYDVSQGTSMAAPYVSGVAALLSAAQPQLSAAQLRERIMQTAKPLSSLNGKMVSPGIVSALRAIQGTTTINNPGTGNPNNPGLPGAPGTPASPVSPGAPQVLSYSTNKVTPGKKASFTMTVSEELDKKALKCFSASVSPKPKGSKLKLSLKKNKISAQLVDGSGKTMSWPAKGKFSLSVKNNCALGDSGKTLSLSTAGDKGSKLEFILAKPGKPKK